MTRTTNTNAALALLLTGALGLGCQTKVAQAKAAPTDSPVSVTTATVTSREVPRIVRLTGNLEANRSSDVAADAAGKVAMTSVERGAFVKKGAILARLDAASAAFAAAQANADAEAAIADAELRRSDLVRAERLHAERAIPDAELDRARAAKSSADQRAAGAKARLGQQAKSVGDALIRAPFDGLVAERYIDIGEYVRADTRVVTLVEIDTLRLQLSVPEIAIGAVSEGQDVAFRVSSDDQPHRAAVRFVGPQVRRASRDLVVEAVVDNRDRKLRPGMFATARLEIGRERALMVPLEAIKRDGNTRRIFAIKSGRLEERVVQLGDAHEREVVVLTGVEADERIVTPITDNLQDGAPIRAQ